LRLDQILSKKGSISEENIREAFDYQNQYGGSLVNHLYRLGYADESSLAEALAELTGFPAVCLSNKTIEQNVLDILPAAFVWQHKLLAFEYNPAKNLLKIACENPNQPQLVDELKQLLPNVDFELYIALSEILKCAIIRYFRSHSFGLNPEKRKEEEAGEDTGESGNENNFGNINELLSGAELKSIGDVVRSYGKACRVLIFNDHYQSIDLLKGKLINDNFLVEIAESCAWFCELADQYNPDIQLLLKPGGVNEVAEFIHRLVTNGVSICHRPTFVLTDSNVSEDSASILKYGIEDVFSLDGNIDLLLIKINRVRSRLDAESNRRISVVQDLGTHGTLADMNIIDLLQMMGHSKKTARISITASGRQMTIYLKVGRIIHATCDDWTGPEAVYQGISWSKGVWSVDPVNPDDLPEPNNQLSNDAILLEGCRLLDEKSREVDTSANQHQVQVKQ
jgi:DNA-binding response OmpR family regulator